MAWLGLEPRTSHRPCEHSDHWATQPHGQLVTISPCLIRLVPESARNHAKPDETVPLLLAAQHWPTKCHRGGKKHMARPGLEPRTSPRPCKHSDHSATRSTSWHILSSCKTGVYNVGLLIILERRCSSRYRKKDCHCDRANYLSFGKFLGPFHEINLVTLELFFVLFTQHIHCLWKKHYLSRLNFYLVQTNCRLMT